MGIDFARRMELRMDNKFPDADADRQCLFLLIYAILSQCVAVRDHFPQPEVLEEIEYLNRKGGSQEQLIMAGNQQLNSSK